jgi:hypothetical protein
VVRRRGNFAMCNKWEVGWGYESGRGIRDIVGELEWRRSYFEACNLGESKMEMRWDDR